MSELSPARYESSDASPRPIALTALGVIAGLGLCAATVSWICGSGEGTKGDASFRESPAEVTGIERDWQQQDSAVGEHLNGYAWVDRRAGIVRIPIDRAIDQMLRESAAPGKETAR